MYKKKGKDDRFSVAEARRDLASLIRRAEAGEVVELTRRGEPVAYVVGRTKFEALTGTKGDFRERLQKFRAGFDFEGMDEALDEALRDVRDPSPGRDVSPWD